MTLIVFILLFGMCYYFVRHFVRNSVFWHRRATEQGDVSDQLFLGSCYYSGDGVPQDYAEAVNWWRKAAEQKLLKSTAIAQYKLGMCYANGQGVAKDEAEAVTWFCNAARRGFAEAEEALKKITAQ